MFLSDCHNPSIDYACPGIYRFMSSKQLWRKSGIHFLKAICLRIFAASLPPANRPEMYTHSCNVHCAILKYSCSFHPQSSSLLLDEHKCAFPGTLFLHTWSELQSYLVLPLARAASISHNFPILFFSTIGRFADCPIVHLTTRYQIWNDPLNTLFIFVVKSFSNLLG